ncbi:MAG: glucosamine-6-phosphate isomerase [bacterium]
MNYYAKTKQDLLNCKSVKFTVVSNVHDLNISIAREIADYIKLKNSQDEKTHLILPVGPLDYFYLADVCNKEKISLENLVLFMMDEYVGDNEEIIPHDHPLGFYSFMKRSFVDKLDIDLNFNIQNINFPDPHNPELVTKKIEQIGGVDICYGGFGITGHFAFNDPPEPEETMTVEEMGNTRARVLTISRESTVQMAMGGTNGNLNILPTRAVTLGMHELLMSKKIHLTFMRSWHAGVLRRALFGPVTVECPGSLIQNHPNFCVTLTELAAQPPIVNVAQATGEEK